MVRAGVGGGEGPRHHFGPVRAGAPSIIGSRAVGETAAPGYGLGRAGRRCRAKDRPDLSAAPTCTSQASNWFSPMVPALHSCRLGGGGAGARGRRRPGRTVAEAGPDCCHRRQTGGSQHSQTAMTSPCRQPALSGQTRLAAAQALQLCTESGAMYN